MPRSVGLQRLLYQGRKGHPLDRLKELEQDAEINSISDVVVQELSELSENLGRVTAGEFISPSSGATSVEPTEAGFTGVFQSGDAKQFSAGDFNAGAIKNGSLSAGYSTNGDMIAGSGSIVINETGIDIGPGKIFLGADGAWGGLGDGLLDTANFNGALSLTGSGGYSNLATGANGDVYCIAKDSSNNIYIGGGFTQVGGENCYGIAKWDGSTWSRMTTGFNGNVYAIIAVSPTEVYAFGAFTKTYAVGGDAPASGTDLVPTGGGGTGATSLKRMAKWNGTTWTQLTAGGTVGADATIRAAVISGTTITVAGEFTSVFATSATRIAQFDTGTLAVTALGAGLNDTCYGLALSGSDVYAVGKFTGTPAYVGKYSGGSWSTPGSSPPTAVTYAIAISGTDVYIGGNWTGYVKKSSSGGAWSTVGASGPGATVRALAIDGTNIIAGYDGSPYVKYYNGSTWTNLGTGLNGICYAVLVDTTWLLGGAYTTADDAIMYRISRYSTLTAPTTLSLQSAMDMLDDHSHYVPLSFRVDSTVGIGVTGYAGLSGASLYTTSANSSSAVSAGTIRSIGIYMSTNMSGGTGQIDITLQKNGSDTGITFSIPQGSAAGVYTSTTTTLVTYAVTDRLSVKFVNNASVASGSFRGGYVEFAPS